MKNQRTLRVAGAAMLGALALAGVALHAADESCAGCGGLSQQADPGDRAVPGRRGRGRGDPHDRAQGRRGSRPVDGRRESRGRRRQHRPRRRGARTQGRLHAARYREQLRRQSVALPQGQLRSAEGLHADRRAHPHAVGAGGPVPFAVQVGGGRHRLRQGQPRQAQLRIGRQWLARALQRGAVQDVRGHRDGPRAVQGRPRHHDVADGQADRPRVPGARQRAAAVEGRHAARARDHRHQAQSERARTFRRCTK